MVRCEPSDYTRLGFELAITVCILILGSHQSRASIFSGHKQVGKIKQQTIYYKATESFNLLTMYLITSKHSPCPNHESPPV
jgi:hypothetical protein